MHSLISCRAELAFQVRKVQIVIDLILLKHVWYKTVPETYREKYVLPKEGLWHRIVEGYILVKCSLQYSTPLFQRPSVFSNRGPFLPSQK